MPSSRRPAARAGGRGVAAGAGRGAEQAGSRQQDRARRAPAARRTGARRATLERLAASARARRTRPPRTSSSTPTAADRRRGRRGRDRGAPAWDADGTGDRRARRRAPYDVLVGAGALGRGREAARRSTAGRGGQPTRRRRLARARAHRRAARGGRRHRPVPDRRRRGRQDARHRRRPVLAASPAWGLLRGDAVVALGRRRGGRHRGVRGCRVPPRRRGRAGADHAARPGRRGHRRQDGGEPARGQEPRRRVPPADRRARRRRARSPRCRRASTAPGWARWPSTR